MTDPPEIHMIAVDAITVLNPRARSKRVFSELVTSIANLGLKKPITVSRRPDQAGYDLVCGQDGWKPSSSWAKQRYQQSLSRRQKRIAMS